MTRKSEKDYLRMKRRYNELKLLYLNRCFYCDSTFQLEFAHRLPTKLKGRSRGMKRKIADIIHNPNSYRLTCHDCNDFCMLFID